MASRIPTATRIWQHVDGAHLPVDLHWNIAIGSLRSRPSSHSKPRRSHWQEGTRDRYAHPRPRQVMPPRIRRPQLHGGCASSARCRTAPGTAGIRGRKATAEVALVGDDEPPNWQMTKPPPSRSQRLPTTAPRRGPFPPSRCARPRALHDEAHLAVMRARLSSSGDQQQHDLGAVGAVSRFGGPQQGGQAVGVLHRDDGRAGHARPGADHDEAGGAGDPSRSCLEHRAVAPANGSPGRRRSRAPFRRTRSTARARGSSRTTRERSGGRPDAPRLELAACALGREAQVLRHRVADTARLWRRSTTLAPDVGGAVEELRVSTNTLSISDWKARAMPHRRFPARWCSRIMPSPAGRTTRPWFSPDWAMGDHSLPCTRGELPESLAKPPHAPRTSSLGLPPAVDGPGREPPFGAPLARLTPVRISMPSSMVATDKIENWPWRAASIRLPQHQVLHVRPRDHHALLLVEPRSGRCRRSLRSSR